MAHPKQGLSDSRNYVLAHEANPSVPKGCRAPICSTGSKQVAQPPVEIALMHPSCRANLDQAGTRSTLPNSVSIRKPRAASVFMLSTQQIEREPRL